MLIGGFQTDDLGVSSVQVCQHMHTHKHRLSHGTFFSLFSFSYSLHKHFFFLFCALTCCACVKVCKFVIGHQATVFCSNLLYILYRLPLFANLFSVVHSMLVRLCISLCVCTLRVCGCAVCVQRVCAGSYQRRQTHLLTGTAMAWR